jgi:hypothetical protein
MAIQDPYKGFRFWVEIHGVQQAGFSECSSVARPSKLWSTAKAEIRRRLGN